MANIAAIWSMVDTFLILSPRKSCFRVRLLSATEFRIFHDFLDPPMTSKIPATLSKLHSFVALFVSVGSGSSKDEVLFFFHWWEKRKENNNNNNNKNKKHGIAKFLPPLLSTYRLKSVVEVHPAR